MKKIFYLLMIIPIAFASCEAEEIGTESVDAVYGKGNVKSSELVFEMDGCSGDVRDLIAGQHTVVGTVKVTVDDLTDEYVITYDITQADWCLTEYQIDVEHSPDGFPVGKTGNPKIGNFEFKNDQLGCETNVEVRVPVSKGNWIAAHGVVECSTNSSETILANLPETVDFCGNGFGTDSYISITFDGGVISGDFGSYCVDNDIPINPSLCYEDFSVFVSTESLPEGIENTDNINAVNWILNQDFSGLYTIGEIQYAIWLLLDPIEDNHPALDTLGTYSIEKAEEIVAMANYDFVPECGDFIGIILKKENIQPLIIPFPLECSDCEETVWAEGCNFPGNSWAMYFKYE